MADAESLRQAVQSRAPLSTWLGVVLLFALFGVIVLAVVGPAPRGDDYEQKRAKAREEKLRTLREADAKQLTTYEWIDKNKGVVRLPIERAMELTVAELSSKRPVPAYPIATPAAQATPGGAAAPSPRPAPPVQASATPKPISSAPATPTAAPPSSAAGAPVSPSPMPSPSTAGSPLPVQGKTPP
jgi:hypothetical protein